MGIYVNFSNEEANSEARDPDPLPSGKYLVIIDECELGECGPNSKNPGKPKYSLRFNVIEDKRGGQFKGRKAWTQAMLFSPALYTISHLMKATGVNVAAGEFEVPEADFFVGKTVVIGGQLTGETKNKETGQVYAPRFEVKAIFAPETWDAKPGAGGKAQAGAGSLLS